MMLTYESIIEWINQLPRKYRHDLVAEISYLYPGIEANPYHVRFIDQVLGSLDSLAGNDKAKQTGMALSLAAMIDYIVALKNEANSNWQQEKRELDEMVEMTGSCSLATAAAEKAMQFSQWSTILQGWQELKDRA